MSLKACSMSLMNFQILTRADKSAHENNENSFEIFKGRWTGKPSVSLEVNAFEARDWLSLFDVHLPPN